MTIFFRAAQKFILASLEQSMEEASAANQGFFGGLRNAEINKAQKDLTSKLKQFFTDFKCKSTDLESLAAIKKKVTETDAEVEKIRTAKGFERGHLNAVLTDINSNIERFYNAIRDWSGTMAVETSGKSAEQLIKFPLIDIPDNEDPFNILCALSAEYMASNIFEPVKDGILVKAVEAVIGTSNVLTRKMKEDCLLKNVYLCQHRLNGLKEGSGALRKELVILQIETIQRENAKICKDAKISGSIPVSLSVIATANVMTPSVKPSRGRLEKCMQEALTEIGTLVAEIAPAPAPASV